MQSKRTTVKLTSTLTRRRLVSSCKTSVLRVSLAWFCLSLVAELENRKWYQWIYWKNVEKCHCLKSKMINEVRQQRPCLSSIVVVTLCSYSVCWCFFLKFLRSQTKHEDDGNETSANKRFKEQNNTCVINFCTFICCPLQNKNVKWLKFCVEWGTETTTLIFRISIWDWPLLLHI